MDVNINIKDIKCDKCGETEKISIQITHDFGIDIIADTICMNCRDYKRFKI